MMERDILHEQIRELKMMMDRAFYTRNSVFAIIRSLFLKYITDNTVGAETKEDMKVYAIIQKYFAARDIVCDPNVLYIAFEIVEREYKLNNIFESVIPDYVQELFGFEKSWSIAKENVSKRIIGKIAEIDLTESDESHSVGKLVVKELTTMLFNADYRNITGIVTGKSLAKIAQKILRVEEGDRYLDFASGTGLSTLNIVENTPCKIYNMDILGENLSLTAMFYIMYGYKDFQLSQKNFFDAKSDIEVDKIFVDPPFGKIKDMGGNSMDFVPRAVDMATAYLDFDNVNGLAVVAVSSGYLFGTAKNLCFLKQNLLANGFLKAIVALPLNVPGTIGMTVNLAVLSTQKNEKILLVNACGKAFSKYVTKDKRENIISEEGINKVAEIVNYGIQEEGLSTVVSVDEIMKNNFDLMPSRYVKEIRTGADMTLEEIDNRLAALYAKLGIREKK